MDLRDRDRTIDFALAISRSAGRLRFGSRLALARPGGVRMMRWPTTGARPAGRRGVTTLPIERGRGMLGSNRRGTVCAGPSDTRTP